MSWSSAICERPPNTPDVRHWTMGLLVSAAGLFVTLYLIAEQTVPVRVIDDAEVEQVVVSLGAPAQRLEPPPPELIPDDPPDDPPPPPEVKTERSEEAPPPEAPPEPRYFPPVQQTSGPLSSGFSGPVEAPPPPPVELSKVFVDISMAEYISHMRYPYNALRHNIQGTGRIKIEIDRKGRILNWVLIQSTGSEILDDEIERVARKVTRIDPLPEEYPFPKAKLIIPFTFVMQ